VVSTDGYEHYDVLRHVRPFFFHILWDICRWLVNYRYVFAGAGLSGTRGNLIASSVQYVLNVAATVPAIIFIDRWGRRPMLLGGLFFMALWLYLVGGLQATYGAWGKVGDETVWVIQNNQSVTLAIIVCSYLFVCSFAVTMGPVSWTYPSEIFPMRVRAKAVSLSTAANWIFNFALAYGAPPGLASISWGMYILFGSFNVLAFIHVFFMFPETAGRSLEEVEAVFNSGHTFAAWKLSDRSLGRKALSDIKTSKAHKDNEKNSIEEREHASVEA
jgi:MFS family permease